MRVFLWPIAILALIMAALAGNYAIHAAIAHDLFSALCYGLVMMIACYIIILAAPALFRK